MAKRSILIVGGTGFIGSHLAAWRLDRGDDVRVWARNVRRATQLLPRGIGVIGALDGIPRDARVDVIVNLAGAPAVGPPWTSARRKLLIDSRVQPTLALIDWCGSRPERPQVMISASAIGFYGTGGETLLDERSPPTQEFQSVLCQQREAATAGAATLGIRVVNARFGVVLGADGGLFSRLALAARWGAAAILGDGQQWMSWIHLTDTLAAIDRMMVDPELRGPVNVVSPEPVRQREFQRVLTRTLHRPLWLRAPEPVLRTMLGEMSDLLVRSQRVLPALLQQRGFDFAFPEIEAAVQDLVRRGRS